MKIAVIGCGAIGASVLELLKGHAAVQVGWVLVPEVTDAVRATLVLHAPQARAVPSLAAEDRPDLIVECAGHAAIEEHVLPALRRGLQPAIGHLRIAPQDIGEQQVGHFAFFRSAYQATLWPIALTWLQTGALAPDTPGRQVPRS